MDSVSGIVNGMGDVLNIVPNKLGLEKEGARACCVAGECYACAWVWDLLGTLPTMWLIEPKRNQNDLSVFAKYTCTWPCRACLWPCFYFSGHENVNELGADRSNDGGLPEYSGWCEQNGAECCSIPVYPFPYRKDNGYETHDYV